MYTLSLFVPFAIASTTLGAALTAKRDVASACNAFSTDAVPTETVPFILTAVYNDQSTAPLSLGTFSSSATAGTSFLTPTAAGGAVVASQFIMQNAGLIGLGSELDGNKTWISGILDDTAPFPFSVSPDPATNPGIDEDYCLVVGSAHPDLASLAARGTLSGWSICNRTDVATEQGVIFKAATFSADFGFNFDTCRTITIKATHP